MRHAKIVQAFLAAALSAGMSGVVAQAPAPYPSRTVTLVVPFTPGTGIDVLARTLGPRLSERWGQAVVVENKPGASGNIGADFVAKSAPNGYTLMVTVNTFAITPALYRTLPYDPLNDFAPVSEVAVGSLALTVNPTALPAATLAEVIVAAKARPGQINYGSPGNGTPQHLGVELLKQRLGIDVVHVPYKGSAGALTDLLGGQISLMLLPVHTALPHVRAGKLRVLAVSGEQRSSLLPESPTFRELRVEDFDIDLWFGVFAPRNTPAELIAKLNQDIAAVLGLADVRENLLKQGLVPVTSTPAALAALLRVDLARWGKVVSAARISAD